MRYKSFKLKDKERHVKTFLKSMTVFVQIVMRI